MNGDPRVVLAVTGASRHYVRNEWRALCGVAVSQRRTLALSLLANNGTTMPMCRTCVACWRRIRARLDDVNGEPRT